METVVFLLVAVALAYVVVYTPVSAVFCGSKAPSRQDSDNKLIIPEDSALKRHFLSNLQAEVEMELSPRPTCSMLKRHHDSLVAVEMEKRLAA